MPSNAVPREDKSAPDHGLEEPRSAGRGRLSALATAKLVVGLLNDEARTDVAVARALSKLAVHETWRVADIVACRGQVDGAFSILADAATALLGWRIQWVPSKKQHRPVYDMQGAKRRVSAPCSSPTTRSHTRSWSSRKRPWSARASSTWSRSTRTLATRAITDLCICSSPKAWRRSRTPRFKGLNA